MNYEFGLTEGPVNTQYAPLGILLAYYEQKKTLEPLDEIELKMKSYQYTGHDKLKQVFASILAGCETLSEVNQKLHSEHDLAKVCTWSKFADQSTLSRTLDALSQMNIEQLRKAQNEIWKKNSQVMRHDWRGYLWLDFDLSGLPCGKRAEESQKGYFCGKKTPQDVS